MLTSLILIAAIGQDINYFDARGNYIGKSVERQSGIKYYDDRGTLLGRATASRLGQETRFFYFDSRWNPLGQTKIYNGRLSQYDRHGKYLGSGRYQPGASGKAYRAKPRTNRR